jgi:thiol-disulfide isomerase/thioredoxin
MDHAMVGRCAKPQEGNSGVWHFRNFIFNCVLDIILVHMKYFVLLSLSIVVAFGLSGCTSSEKKQESKPEVNELPYLSYTDLKTGAQTTTRSMPGNSILILFNSDCDHCQREAGEISAKEGFFKNHELFFIASDSVHLIENFARTYKLADKPNVHFGRADYMDVYMNFGSIPTPAIYIYSKERKLVKSFLGETPVEELVKYL